MISDIFSTAVVPYNLLWPAETSHFILFWFCPAPGRRVGERGAKRVRAAPFDVDNQGPVWYKTGLFRGVEEQTVSSL